ncbi:hypothetical protein OEZ85_001776 [Tetradesmus obliquus]|uniref:Uncharacterized protein n=1 Tax=Tetradesmus obliquus TaxID=3088 RepID=A0ABY8U1U3_TETOB|nr:hypothetical protein OEZ85_001776 [Tetradesmus obliquus]
MHQQRLANEFCDSAFGFCRTYLECLNVRARLLVLQREGAMASVAEQQQLKKEQLLASLGQLLAGQSPDIQAAAILAVGNLNVLTCATLMEREEDVRRAAVMQLVQQATAAAAAAAPAAAATAAANQALGRNTFNSRMVTMEEIIEEKLEQMKQQIDEQSKQIAALQQEGVVQFGHLKVH